MLQKNYRDSGLDGNKLKQVFQRAETVHETQAGFLLEYQNKHARYIQYKYAFPHEVFLCSICKIYLK